MLLVVVVLLSLGMASFSMRALAFWSVLPTWLVMGVVDLLGIESQEGVASIEFLLAWVLCLFLLMILTAAIALAKKRRR